MQYSTEITELTKLLTILWESVDKEYKRKYSIKIWTQFEENIKAAAMTKDLKAFLNLIVQKLLITVKNDKVTEILNIINKLDDKKALKELRTNTTFLVLLVRFENQEKQNDYLEKELINDNN